MYSIAHLLRSGTFAALCVNPTCRASAAAPEAHWKTRAGNGRSSRPCEASTGLPILGISTFADSRLRFFRLAHSIHFSAPKQPFPEEPMSNQSFFRRLIRHCVHSAAHHLRNTQL